MNIFNRWICKVLFKNINIIRRIFLENVAKESIIFSIIFRASLKCKILSKKKKRKKKHWSFFRKITFKTDTYRYFNVLKGRLCPFYFKWDNFSTRTFLFKFHQKFNKIVQKRPEVWIFLAIADQESKTRVDTCRRSSEGGKSEGLKYCTRKFLASALPRLLNGLTNRFG